MNSKYWWMINVHRTIRAYPELRMRKDDTQRQSIIASYSSDPHGGSGAKRNTEMAALRGLAPAEEAALDAIEQSLAEADLRSPEIRRMVKLHYWDGWTMEQIARSMHVSRETVIRWNGWIVRKIAARMGLYVKR